MLRAMDFMMAFCVRLEMDPAVLHTAAECARAVMPRALVDAQWRHCGDDEWSSILRDVAIACVWVSEKYHTDEYHGAGWYVFHAASEHGAVGVLLRREVEVLHAVGWSLHGTAEAWGILFSRWCALHDPRASCGGDPDAARACLEGVPDANDGRVLDEACKMLSVFVLSPQTFASRDVARFCVTAASGRRPALDPVLSASAAAAARRGREFWGSILLLDASWPDEDAFVGTRGSSSVVGQRSGAWRDRAWESVKRLCKCDARKRGA